MDTQTTDRPGATVLDLDPQPQGLAAREEPRQAPRAQVVRDIPASGPSETRVVVRHSPELGELFGALSTAQGMFETLERTRTARIESSKAKYTYDFETLADVIEATKAGLSQNGLAVLQFPFPLGRESMLIRTYLGHKSGQWIYNDLTATIDGNDPRSEGSGITYLCRYARKAILGIAAEYDDDAAQATLKGPLPQAAPRRSEQAEALPPTPPAPAAVVREANVGLVQSVAATGDAWFVTLDTGFVAGTRTKALADEAQAFHDQHQRVLLDCQPPKTAGKTPLLIRLVSAGKTA